ncbi:MAG: hypothetical protein JWP06_240 [Candidatus Saccharibacteria bacterium]|nr:hypothetical protein [Candidatus Saccharibacteria bacterium]
MTTETLQRASSVREDDPVKKILIVGPGANTRNLLNAPGGLRESGHHDIYYAGISTAPPAIEIPEGHLYEVDTPEGRESLQRLLADEAFHATYYSTPAEYHEKGIIDGLQELAEGRGKVVVATKPVVENTEQARRVRTAIKLTQRRLRERLGESYNPVETPPVLVHEHYLKKGAWVAVRKQIPELSKRFGRLESAEVHIQERRTAKDEGREKVVGAGAFEDLGPHALSLGLDAQRAINEDPDGLYLITDNSQMDVDFVRHDDPGFADNETGFRIRGTTQVIDKKTADTHELNFVWCGGKGLIDKKEVRLTFVDEMGVRTTIVADLIANRIVDVPDPARDLFPEVQYVDNGYGESVAAGLNGGIPKDNFQLYEDAEKVVLWGSKLTEKGRAKGAPIPYSGNKSIEDIFAAA